MAQVYKVEMKTILTTFIKADSEDQLIDWMNEHSPERVASEYGLIHKLDYKDKVICPVNGDEEINISWEA